MATAPVLSAVSRPLLMLTFTGGDHGHLWEALGLSVGPARSCSCNTHNVVADSNTDLAERRVERGEVVTGRERVRLLRRVSCVSRGAVTGVRVCASGCSAGDSGASLAFAFPSSRDCRPCAVQQRTRVMGKKLIAVSSHHTPLSRRAPHKHEHKTHLEGLAPGDVNVKQVDLAVLCDDVACRASARLSLAVLWSCTHQTGRTP